MTHRSKDDSLNEDSIIMSVNTKFTPADRPKRVMDLDDNIPRVHLEESIENLQNQIKEFRFACAKDSTIDLVESENVRTSIPKIGEKLSKLSSVKTNLVKRYQIARAARVEANRRIKVCNRLTELRERIDQDADFMPLIGATASRKYLRARVNFNRYYLVDTPLVKFMGKVMKTDLET